MSNQNRNKFSTTLVITDRSVDSTFVQHVITQKLENCSQLAKNVSYKIYIGVYPLKLSTL